MVSIMVIKAKMIGLTADLSYYKYGMVYGSQDSWRIHDYFESVVKIRREEII